MGLAAEEIGYGVLTEYSGRGIGTEIVRFSTEKSEALVTCAWVSGNNRGSERCFEKNSFKKLLNKQKCMLSYSITSTISIVG